MTELTLGSLFDGIGGFPLATLLIMGGIVVVFIVLSVILSCRGKRGDRQ